MTCRDALSLLDDLIDNELDSAQAADIRSHLAQCESCRAEYDQSSRLKSLLARERVPEPPEEYWSEVGSIVHARTVDSVPLIRERTAGVEERANGRRALIRSAAVFAASAVLLVSALMISGRHSRRVFTPQQRAPVYVSSHLASQMNRPPSEYLSRQDQARIAGGTLIVGAPSMVGRYSSLAGIPSIY